MTNWQRLEQVVDWSNMSTNRFALSIGLKRSENLYQIKRGNFGISKELARLICQKYPEISKLWLLTGEGEMLTNTEASEGNILNSISSTTETISRRDFFAGIALCGMFSNAAFMTGIDKITELSTADASRTIMAKTAYELADQFIVESNSNDQ